MNPIINYIDKEKDKVMPKELFETLKSVLNDKDVDNYLTKVVNRCASAINQSPDSVIESFRIITLAGMAVGYMYGAEGNKTPTDVATDVLKDLNIKEGE